MKKNILILLLATLASSQILYSSGNHDSLLFDGETNIRTETYYSKSDEECVYRVTYVKGTATGKIRKMQVIDVCGIRKDTIYEYQNGAIEKYSVIKGGEIIKTGPESTAKIDLPDGSEIILGPNTNYTLPVNVCDNIRSGSLDIGAIWVKLKRLINGTKFEVTMDRFIVGVRGTEFSVEVIEENGVKYDIVKVYEGSVEVNMKSMDTENFENNQNELARLAEELQAGKITPEEYSARSVELMKVQTGESTKLKVKQLVEAGYVLRSDGKSLGDPVPFNTSEDTWFIINE